MLRISRVAAMIATGSVFAAATASDIGLEIANQVQVATYQDVHENHLYTQQGHNRNYNGAHHDLARDNIVALLQGHGLPVELNGFTYQGSTYYNVIAEQRGVLYPDEVYVVGAHYDSVNNAGADDDASGVAAVIELARILSQYETAYTIRYCAWDVEERGLVGSTAYVAGRRSDTIRGMIQLDMIAKDNGANAQDIYGSATAAPLKNGLIAAFPVYGNGVNVQSNGAANFSDHHPFDQAGYQAVCFVEDNYVGNTCYHQACDYENQPNYINYPFAIKMVRVVAGYLADNARAFHADDCNGDGVSDAQQIASSALTDCNGNGFPDVCEVGIAADCDSDGTSNVCEIAAGAADTDSNGVPDACQTVRRVPTDFATIQAAINAAVAGDTVLVAPGTYTGTGNKNLDFGGKSIVVRGETGAANTIIDCQNSGRGFYFHTNETRQSVVDGFTIRGGSITVGAGIYCVTASPTIANCLITANTATQSGGGVYAFTRADPYFVNCRIVANACPTGGGVRARLGSLPTFVGCVIAANAGTNGAGIEASQTSLATLVNCTISRNAATQRGGAFNLSEVGSVTLHNSIVWGNTATTQGPTAYTVVGTSVSANRSNVQGGPAAIVGGGAATGWVSTINADPLFVDAAANDYRLPSGSPCVDAGDNALLASDAADVDRDGNRIEALPIDVLDSVRLSDDPQTADSGAGAVPIVDLGAIELVQPCVGDTNGDGARDLTDLARLLSNFGMPTGATIAEGDADADGDVDLTDLATLLANFGLNC
ncbi:MAG: M28 family peptidase [Phycisphaerae bacterium]